MLPLNIFSVHDLAGFTIIIPLVVIFYIAYWTLGRHLLDLLFANWIGIGAVYCLVAFLQDNLVPQGTSSWAVAGAGARALLLFRIAYVLGALALASELHFVLRYCRVRNAFSRNIHWVYVASVLAIPAVWSNLFLAQRNAPLAETSSWTVAVPWMPHAGPLVGVFMLIWAGTLAYSLYLLFRPRATPLERGALSHVKLVRLALIFQAGTALVDVLLGFTGLATIATLPIGLMVVAVLVATALVRERIVAMQQHERMGHEMELAAHIQSILLPHDYPPVCGYELAGWSQAAEQTGGDTYDFFNLPDGRWMVTVADAVGHGLGAALMVAETRAILRATAQQCSETGVILNSTHKLLAHDLPEGDFVTCFVGVLDPLCAALSYASAGHGPILFYDLANDRLTARPATALPLASFHDLDFSPGLLQTQLQPGDFLVLVTDGFYESVDPQGQQFGVQRLTELLHQVRHDSADEMIRHARQAVLAFLNGVHPVDDMTMVVLRRRSNRRAVTLERLAAEPPATM